MGNQSQCLFLHLKRNDTRKQKQLKGEHGKNTGIPRPCFWGYQFQPGLAPVLRSPLHPSRLVRHLLLYCSERAFLSDARNVESLLGPNYL